MQQTAAPARSSPPTRPTRWVVRAAERDTQQLRDNETALRDALGVEALPARVLAARGVTDASLAASVLNPTLHALHDPTLLPGCDRAAERILDAARTGQRIAIYGDYDVDGITATSILYHAIRALAPDADIVTYVPHRLDEGYGLNDDALRSLAESGARLIISVDCGITAAGPARVARDLGVDLIITDHHNLPSADDPAALPDAFALVHPRVGTLTGDADYPFGELCGAGVAFKLAWRLGTMHVGGGRVSDAMQTVLLDLLALAALGTIADIVPLEDENRVIARFGLARIKSTGLIGLRALLEASNLAGESIDAEHAGFQLGPRLNACGRMGHARDAVELFTTAAPERAAEIAARLSAQNTERRAVERRIFDQAAELAEQRGMTGDAGRRAIVLAHADWHPGVVGIVCSRLVRAFNRPALLMQQCDAEGSTVATCKGSGRSIDGYNLHAALTHCREHLTTFGGHDMAAGLSLDAAKLDAFTDALCEHAGQHVTDAMMLPSVNADCHAAPHELSELAVKQLEQLGPFGRANPKPRVVLRRLSAVWDAKRMGREGKHLNLTVSAARGDERAPRLRLVGWNMGDRAPSLHAGVSLDAVIEPKLNHWNGRTSVQGVIADLCVSD